jgi:hypothetical protein
MSSPSDSETVRLITEGRMVMTRRAIDRLHGFLKCKPGGKSFAAEWAEHKREERELEERNYARNTGSRSPRSAHPPAG